MQGALDHVSIAVVDGSTVTYAHFGANEHTQYEIGSLTKTLTALLLADAIRRVEVTADTKVGALLPLGSAPIADVTLAELASHRSDLSAQGRQLDDTIPFLLRYFRHYDPFVQDVEGVLAIARKATLTNRGQFVYSNLGVALLGQALDDRRLGARGWRALDRSRYGSLRAGAARRRCARYEHAHAALVSCVLIVGVAIF